MNVKFKKISENAVAPQQAHPSDAGYDLVAVSRKTNKNPVFLIDDIFSSLDVDRSKRLLRFVEKLKLYEESKPQTIITTTDLLNVEQSGLISNNKDVKTHKLEPSWNI